ncbi:olfactory receptor 1044-like [Microcaecilia unicolor]|uniref:Olfactory receptor n=1 Tax=Microcaecilia unicolor TaxID=1415580 RepID=A0A6P7WQN1_9AMPH|nr:olfactory receptor 1044-like [Microcaecilia unicolor]
MLYNLPVRWTLILQTLCFIPPAQCLSSSQRGHEDQGSCRSRYQVKSPHSMGERNQTSVTEFILLGFSDHPQLQGLICGTVLLIYLISVLGNFVFLVLMCANPQLHKPMYFFLSNLSIMDICSTSLTLLKMLDSYLTQNYSISFHACITQVYFFMYFSAIEYLLLTEMAYDRYVAICNPLRYSLIMNKSICLLLASSSWVTAFLASFPVANMLSQLSYCKSNVINHFFCDPSVLMKLSCSDTHRVAMWIFVDGIVVGFIPFLLILTSYIFIISSILRIRCTEGRHKAFSTCASHLTSVILYCVSILCMYMKPTSMYSSARDKMVSLLYTAMVPTLNPIIYSLRNREIKNTFKKIKCKSKNSI